MCSADDHALVLASALLGEREGSQCDASHQRLCWRSKPKRTPTTAEQSGRARRHRSRRIRRRRGSTRCARTRPRQFISASNTDLRTRVSSSAGGRRSCSWRALRLCRKTRPRLERGGRRTTASHQSRPRTVAPPPDTSTQKPPARAGNPVQRPHRPALHDRPQADRVTTVPHGPAGADLAPLAGASMRWRGGVIACGCSHVPKSPGEIRSNSGLGQAFCPVSRGFQGIGGAEQHVT